MAGKFVITPISCQAFSTLSLKQCKSKTLKPDGSAHHLHFISPPQHSFFSSSSSHSPPHHLLHTSLPTTSIQHLHVQISTSCADHSITTLPTLYPHHPSSPERIIRLAAENCPSCEWFERPFRTALLYRSCQRLITTILPYRRP